MSLDLFDPANRMAAASEIDRLAGIGDRLRGGIASLPARYGNTDAELDPDLHEARAIVVSQLDGDDAMLTGPDVQAVDRIGEDDVSRAIIELARLRGEPVWQTQALVVDMAGGNRDVLSLSHAITALADGGQRHDYHVSDEVILSQTFAGSDVPAYLSDARTGAMVGELVGNDDLDLALSHALAGNGGHSGYSHAGDVGANWHDAESDRLLALAGQGGGLQVPIASAVPATSGQAAQVARIVAQNPDLLSEDTGLPFRVYDVGADGDPAQAVDPDDALRQIIANNPDLFTGNISTQALGPVPQSRWNQYGRGIADGIGHRGTGNPSAGQSGSIAPLGTAPRGVAMADRSSGATVHTPLPLTFSEAVAQRGGELFLTR